MDDYHRHKSTVISQHAAADSEKNKTAKHTHTHKAALTVQKTARRILLYGFRGAAQEHPPDFSPARPPEQSGTRNHLAFTESTV